MIVRIATFEREPSDNRDWVIDALRGVPGVRAAYHVRHPELGTVLSISVFDDEAASERAHTAIAARAQEIGHQGYPPDDIQIYHAVRYVENR